MSVQKELAAELQTLGGECTALDFKNVRYIDSSCLTELVRAGHRVRAADPASSITLLNVEPQVRRIFEITQLERYFNLL